MAPLIEFWALLPDGRRVFTKREKVGRHPRFVACFEDTDGQDVWWCHTFYDTEGSAKCGLKVHLRNRAMRLRKAGVPEGLVDLRDAILPAYFLVHEQR